MFHHTNALDYAKEQYAAAGTDVELALERLARIPISIHCWQGDDVAGFEMHEDASSGGGIQATGNYPGRARNIDELRADFEKAVSLIPGRHRMNLHASYGEFSSPVERTDIGLEHFQGWIDWANEHHLGLDFNPTYFAHPKADDGFTLSHPDPAIREYWIRHGIACRRIAAEMGKQLETPCVNNIWIPDGYKDIPVDRLAPRERLAESLDATLREPFDHDHLLDAVESKLFGLGLESYTVGSHEFYLGYASSRKTLLCIDAGHYHPTESIADKISSCLLFVPELLLHVSRGVRWDSDHVIVLNDDLRGIMEEIVRPGYFDRVHIGLDFFDASINRVAAWVIGVRNALKALLLALLEPTDKLRELELAGRYTERLALLEDIKSLPFGIIWAHYCEMMEVPGDGKWMNAVQDYERKVLSQRG